MTRIGKPLPKSLCINLWKDMNFSQHIETSEIKKIRKKTAKTFQSSFAACTSSRGHELCNHLLKWLLWNLWPGCWVPLPCREVQNFPDSLCSTTWLLWPLSRCHDVICLLMLRKARWRKNKQTCHLLKADKNCSPGHDSAKEQALFRVQY